MSQTNMTALVAKDDPELLITTAQTLAEKLKGGGRRDATEATKTQVRRLFSTLQQIEMSWPREETTENAQEKRDAYRELLLFKPRLAYQASRHWALKPLVEALHEGIDAVSVDQNREKLKRLVQFFEATLAYYIAR